MKVHMTWSRQCFLST